MSKERRVRGFELWFWVWLIHLHCSELIKLLHHRSKLLLLPNDEEVWQLYNLLSLNYKNVEYFIMQSNYLLIFNNNEVFCKYAWHAEFYKLWRCQQPPLKPVPYIIYLAHLLNNVNIGEMALIFWRWIMEFSN